MIGKRNPSEEPWCITNVDEYALAFKYLTISRIPILIKNPFRLDNNPSLFIYSLNGRFVRFYDFSLRETGSIWKLLTQGLGLKPEELEYEPFKETRRVSPNTGSPNGQGSLHSDTDFKVKTRDWEKHDLEYWNSYGISMEWLKFANIYPISHKIIIKDGIDYLYKADKYAYAYVEFKDDRIFIKIYQPFNKNGFKWSGKQNKSILSLWRQIPQRGKILCICASMKDALCLWSNTSIPSIAPQGEGYSIGPVVVKDLRERFDKVFILFDGDEPGLKDTQKLAESTGFQPLVFPRIGDCKDVSDLYKHLKDKEKFKQIMLNLFKTNYYGK